MWKGCPPSYRGGSLPFGKAQKAVLTRSPSIKHKNGHSSSHMAPQKLAMARFGSKLRRASF